MPDAAPRPPQVTIAAWLVMTGSVVVVVAAFDQVAGLHTLETREAVEEFVGAGLGEALGLDVPGALTLLRVLAMVSAACATAAAILGYHVLRRSRSARLGLTVLAVPLFLAGMGQGGIVASVVVGAIVMLWFQPARDWVDGKTPARPQQLRRREPAGGADAPSLPPLPPLPPVPEAPPTDESPSDESPSDESPSEESPGDTAGPRPVAGFGDRGRLLDSLPPPTTAPLGAAAAPRTAPARSRPAALVWACVLTWAGSALVALAMLATVVVLLAEPDLLLDEILRQNPGLEDDGLSADTLRTTVLYIGAMAVMWAVTAVVMAVYAFRGRSWAWTALVISAGGAGGLCVVASVGNPAVLVLAAACLATVVLLMRPEVRAFVSS